MKFSSTKKLANHPQIKGGIIFVGFDTEKLTPKNKGKLLQDLISKGYFGKVNSVFFIDDTLKNLQNMEKALDENILFTGVHFTAIKEKILRNLKEDELDILAKNKIDKFTKN